MFAVQWGWSRVAANVETQSRATQVLVLLPKTICATRLHSKRLATLKSPLRSGLQSIPETDL